MRLVLFAAVVVIAAGCGGVDNEPNLAAAIEKTEDAGSLRIEIAASDIEDGKPIEIACRGEADYEGRRLRITCDYGDMGDLDYIAIGNTTYLRGDLFGLRGDATKWVKSTEDEGLAVQLSPQRLLAMLRGASQETRRVGAADVRGVSTVRYRLRVDCEHAELFDCEEATTPVEVWIDEDGFVRRIWLEEESGSGTIEFYDLGVDVDIEAPPTEEVGELDEGTIFGSGSQGDGDSCSEGEASPISTDEAIDVLRQHGFGVRRDGQFCNPAYDTTILTNSSAMSSPDFLAHEGFLNCNVMKMKSGGAGKMLVEGQHAGADAKLRLENLECTIFVDGPGTKEIVDRLEGAFDELKQAIRP